MEAGTNQSSSEDDPPVDSEHADIDDLSLYGSYGEPPMRPYIRAERAKRKRLEAIYPGGVIACREAFAQGDDTARDAWVGRQLRMRNDEDVDQFLQRTDFVEKIIGKEQLDDWLSRLRSQGEI